MAMMNPYSLIDTDALLEDPVQQALAPPKDPTQILAEQLLAKKSPKDKEIRDIKSTSKKTTYLSQDDLNALTQASMQNPFLQQQEKGIEDQMAVLRAMSEQPAQIDFSPLAGLAESVSGGKYKAANIYKAPESAEDRRNILLRYMNKIQDDRRDLHKSLLSGSSAMKSGDISYSAGEKSGDLDAMNGGKGAASDLRIKETKLLEQAAKDFTKFNEDTGTLSMVTQNLDNNDWQSLSFSLATLARKVAGETGPLSDDDIARTMPKTVGGTAAKMMAFFTDHPEQAIKPEMVAGLKKLADRALEKMSTVYRTKIKTMKNAYKATKSYQNVDVDKILQPNFDVLDTFEKKRQEYNKKKIDMAPAGFADDKEKRFQELMQKKAAGTLGG